MNWKSLFELRGELSSKNNLILSLVGLVLILLFWWGAAEFFSEMKPDVSITTRYDNNELNRDSIEQVDSIKIANATNFIKVYPILPPPQKVISSFPSLWNDDLLWQNLSRSIWLNLQGYIWAILIAIPIGFIIGLFPLFRGLFSQPVDALRYLPLTALTGLFIIWFGIYDQMKIAFLAFGILVYLLPVVVQRIDEVDDVYIKTAQTLGASKWQMIRSVFSPAVLTKLIDDIRVLTAISWTYIIIAELLNRQGGIGALIFLKGKLGQIDRVFALLIVIVIVGFLQDRLFVYIDKKLFPYKYYKTEMEGNYESKMGIFVILALMLLKILQTMFLPAFNDSFNNLVWIGVIASVGFILYGEFKLKSKASENV
ncbi:MAG: ABC transporter permease [Saprospiraceae bacterium]|nr:ABC transporter permease [Saprospiraceae bacterium]